jgi:hypothetical protein
MISGRNQNQEAGVRQVIDNNERQEKSRVKRKIFEDDDDEHLENVYRAKTDLNSSQLQNQLCS